MSSSLGKLPDLSAKEPEESLPPEPTPKPVSGGTFTSENVTNTQASPESSNTAPKNEESKQDSPAGTQEISDEEAEVLDFLLTMRRNTGSMLEALSETALSSDKNEPSIPSEKDANSDKENPNSGISTRENEKLFTCENAANILWALRERKGAGLDIMMEEAVGEADDCGSNEKTRDSKEEDQMEEAPDHNYRVHAQQEKELDFLEQGS